MITMTRRRLRSGRLAVRECLGHPGSRRDAEGFRAREKAPRGALRQHRRSHDRGMWCRSVLCLPQRMAHALFWSHLNQRLKRPAEQRQRTSNCVPKSFSTDFKTCFSWPARCNHCCCSSSQNACDNASQSCHQVQGVPHVFAVIRDQSLYAEGH